MKLRYPLISAALVTSLFFASPVLAQTTATNSSIKAEVKCDISKARLEAHFKNTQIRKDNHVARYKRLKERLDKIVTKLQGKGADISKIQADEVTLDQKVAKVGLDWDNMITKIKAAQTTDCSSNTNYKAAITSVREAFQIVKSDAADIRSYFNNTIKVDVKAAAATVKSSTSTNSGETK